MLKLTNLTKSFGGYIVFTIPELQLHKGIYWLQGINGSGKSTLLKILAGLLPFKGGVSLNGMDLRKQPVAYRKLVNYAEAEPTFPSFLSGTALVEFIMNVKKGNAAQLEELKNILGVGDYLNNTTGGYSSGMLKKVSLLMAFAGNPEWILLDEPFTTLDTATQKKLCGLVTQRRAAGTSFILTSHHDIDMKEIAVDRSFLLAGKRINEIR